MQKLLGQTELSWVTTVWIFVVMAKLTVCSLSELDRKLWDLEKRHVQQSRSHIQNTNFVDFKAGPRFIVDPIDCVVSCLVLSSARSGPCDSVLYQTPQSSNGWKAFGDHKGSVESHHLVQGGVIGVSQESCCHCRLCCSQQPVCMWWKATSEGETSCNVLPLLRD